MEGLGVFKGGLSEAKAHVTPQKLKSHAVVTHKIEANNEKALVIALNRQTLRCCLPQNNTWIVEPRRDFRADSFHTCERKS